MARYGAQNPEARFFSKINIRRKNECWPWLGSFFSNGYGRFTLYGNGKGMRAHRVSFMYFNGHMPKEPLLILHSCDNRICCNPNHLRAGTQKENIQDAVRKNRMSHGERHHYSKLKLKDIREIRKARKSGLTLISIAKKFNTSVSNVHLISKRLAWRNVK